MTAVDTCYRAASRQCVRSGTQACVWQPASKRKVSQSKIAEMMWQIGISVAAVSVQRLADDVQRR